MGMGGEGERGRYISGIRGTGDIRAVYAGRELVGQMGGWEWLQWKGRDRRGMRG